MRKSLVTVITLIFIVSAWAQGAKEGQSTAGEAQPKDRPGVTYQQLIENKWNEVHQDTPAGLYATDPVVHYAPYTDRGANCTTNACFGHGGCAICVPISADIPADSTIVDVYCYTTAGRDDHPISRMANCTDDVGWSTFDKYSVETLKDPRSGQPYLQRVSTVYHNRSSNRVRAVALEVIFK